MNSRRTFLSALLAIPAAAIAALKPKPSKSPLDIVYDGLREPRESAMFFHDGETVREYRDGRFYHEWRADFLPHNYNSSRAYTERDEYWQYGCVLGTGFYSAG